MEMHHHPEIMRFLVAQHVEELRHAAQPIRRKATPAVTDLTDIELRLCRVGDDPALDELATLAEQPLPVGRLVVAAVNGRIVAALPLAGGRVLTDPFAHTAHLRPLLELRAAQLREPEPRHGLIPRSFSLIRGSTHA
jgi:hypothetical protein